MLDEIWESHLEELGDNLPAKCCENCRFWGGCGAIKGFCYFKDVEKLRDEICDTWEVEQDE